MAELAGHFVLVRVLDMRGVNLNVFDFDFDQEWAGLFLNADDTVLGRYAGRKADPGDDYLNLPSLAHAMRLALAKHQQGGLAKPAARAPVSVEQYPAARRLSAKACIHCHQVYDFRRAEQDAAGTFRKEEAWVYPWPENLGLTMKPAQGNQVQKVQAASLAAGAGVRPGDVLTQVGDHAVASFADITYALHRAPERGQLRLAWQREGRPPTATVTLPAGWRVTDISWRASTKRLGPDPTVYGEDLSDADKRALGLTPQQLALRQGQFLSVTARQAGVRLNDVIVGADQRVLEMNARQFLVHIRLNYRVGETIVFRILRDGQRLDIPVQLPRRPPE